MDEPVHVDALAGRQLAHRLADELAWRQTLQHGVDRRQHDHRLLAKAEREAGQTGDALGDDFGIGPDPIVGNRVPRRQTDEAGLGCEEGQRPLERIQASVIAGDMHELRPACPAG